MRGSGSDVPMPVVLAAVRTKIAETSLRAVARDVGMSPTGLQHAVDNESTLRLSTALKLRRWFVRMGAGSGSTDPNTARAAIDVLLAGVPEKEAPQVRRALLAYLAELHRERVPEWLERLRDDG